VRRCVAEGGSAGWQFHGKLWLVAGTGFSGLRSVNLTNETDEHTVGINPALSLFYPFSFGRNGSSPPERDI
jgi:hypothetical protein